MLTTSAVYMSLFQCALLYALAVLIYWLSSKTKGLEHVWYIVCASLAVGLFVARTTSIFADVTIANVQLVSIVMQCVVLVLCIGGALLRIREVKKALPDD